MEFNHDSSFSSGEYGLKGQATQPTQPQQTTQNPEQDAEQLKVDKDRIYSHPMFPLLQLIFQKCELASYTSRDRPSGDIASSDSFNEDIAHFAKQIEEGHHKSATINMSDELDAFMVLAIQVFRYHLLEMDKVHELCSSFTERYIETLKGNMPMDAVIEDRESPKPEDEAEAVAAAAHHSARFLHVPAAPPSASQQLNLPAYPGTGLPASLPHKLERGEHDLGFNQQQQPQQQLRNSATTAHNPQQTMLDPLGNETNGGGRSSDGSGCGDSDTESRGGKSSSNKKRGLFPKQATNILRAWLFQNLSHPYPSEEQKKHLSQQTSLTILQVNNWFINARRRIVQPMIDQSNRAVSAMPYDPRGMAFSIESQQQQQLANAMLGHGLATPGMFNPSGLPMTSTTPSLHGLKYPEQFYSSSGFNALTPSTATAGHSSISPADLHMLSHC